MASPPEMQIDTDTIYQVTVETDRGPIVMELDPDKVPQASEAADQMRNIGYIAGASIGGIYRTHFAKTQILAHLA